MKTPSTTQALHTAALTGLLSLALLSPATAADFTGSLKGVTITDAQATNKAPVATFTYTKNGDIITLDAGDSSDPDGSITNYKWDFGNGTIAEGVTTNYTLLGAATLKVTLTVVDNNNGVAINQQTITPATKGIADDFSTDTSANYTVLKGSLNISGGTAGGGTNWSDNYAYHKTSTGSQDHFVQGKLQIGTGSTDAGSLLLFRCNGTTGYFVNVNSASNRILLASFSGTTVTGIGQKDIPGLTPGYHVVKVTVSGSTIHAYIDLDDNGGFSGANEDLGTWTDSTYRAGNYVGIGSRRGTINTDWRIDNLSAGVL